MLESQIDSLRDKLDQLINCGASFQEVYSVSLTLDELIVAFYSQTIVNK